MHRDNQPVESKIWEKKCKKERNVIVGCNLGKFNEVYGNRNRLGCANKSGRTSENWCELNLFFDRETAIIKYIINSPFISRYQHFLNLVKVINKRNIRKLLKKCDTREYTAVLDSLTNELQSKVC